jgi:hypothetical protein
MAAQECGLPTSQDTCSINNHSKVQCANDYIQCSGNRMPPHQDRCALNYNRSLAAMDKDVLGNHVLPSYPCSNPMYGGMRGCRFDEAARACYLAGDCVCAKAHLQVCLAYILCTCKMLSCTYVVTFCHVCECFNPVHERWLSRRRFHRNIHFRMR